MPIDSRYLKGLLSQKGATRTIQWHGAIKRAFTFPAPHILFSSLRLLHCLQNTSCMHAGTGDIDSPKARAFRRRELLMPNKSQKSGIGFTSSRMLFYCTKQYSPEFPIMKPLLCALLLLSTSCCFSQGSLDKILSALSTAEVFKTCGDFKKDINAKMALVKSRKGLQPDEYNSLRLAYTDVYEKYDAFLKAVKADLSNTDNLKNLLASPNNAAQAYAISYSAVKESYENNFIPQYNSIVNEGTKALPIAVLVKFGIDAFRLIVGSIKSHKIDRQQSLNLVLPLLNEKLFNRLSLQLWSQWNINEPLGYIQKEEIVIPASTLR